MMKSILLQYSVSCDVTCKHTETLKHQILQYSVVVQFKVNGVVRCRLSHWSGKWAAPVCLAAGECSC